jgi:ElaB/YqjD/DUF883 family membrane-anchored ribosome-binding protein
MADTDSTAMGDADVAPPSGTDFQPAEPLRNAGVEFASSGPEEKPAIGGGGGDAAVGVRQQLTEGVTKLQSGAGDQIRTLADTGKQRAAGALDQLARMLTDAADQVDAKLGQQYGGYARTAADQVQTFSRQVQDQDLEALLDQGRELVRKSPAVAVGIAAAAGFVIARLVQSGIDAERA